MADLRSVLRAKAAFAGRDVANALLRGARDALFLRAHPPERPARVVVHLVGNIGDIVASVPSLVALRDRYPDAYLVLVTSAGSKGLPGARDLLSGAKYVDEIVDYTVEDLRAHGGTWLLAKVRALRPDLLIMLPPSLSGPGALWSKLAFARLSGASYVVGLQAAMVRAFELDQAKMQPVVEHEASRLLSLLEPLGVRGDRPVGFDLPDPSDAEKSEVEALAGSRPFAAMCPGGKQVQHLWRLDRFVEIAKRLRGRGLRVVTVGSKGESEGCDRLLEGAGGGVNAAGRLSVLGTTALLEKAEIFVTNDTGPMHLAAAVGTPVVAVFSTRDFAGRWYPYGAGHEVLRARLVCDVCLLAANGTDHCVRDVSVDSVWSACLRVLDRRDRAHPAQASP